jgi:uncharacterized protein (TIGR02246 family)
MEAAGVAAWMDRYRDAWISNDPAQVGALFSDDAVYAIEPFGQPWRGRDEIVRRWTAGISQQVDLAYDVLAVEDDQAIVHWHIFTQNAGDPVRVEYDGILLLRFDADGRCREHREWFAQRERR